MTSSAGSGSLVIQTQDGGYYRIPASQLQSFRMSNDDVQEFLRQQQVSGSDVQGYSMGQGMGMGGGMMPMVMMPMSMMPMGMMGMRMGGPASQGDRAVMRSWMMR